MVISLPFVILLLGFAVLGAVSLLVFILENERD